MATVRDLSGNGLFNGLDATVAINFVELKDGTTAPATKVGVARLYVDSADGDYKVKFGDGVTKVIAADT